MAFIYNHIIIYFPILLRWVDFCHPFRAIYCVLHYSQHCKWLLSIGLFRGDTRALWTAVCRTRRPQVADIIWRVSLCRQQILKCCPAAPSVAFRRSTEQSVAIRRSPAGLDGGSTRVRRKLLHMQRTQPGHLVTPLTPSILSTPFIGMPSTAVPDRNVVPPLAPHSSLQIKVKITMHGMP